MPWINPQVLPDLLQPDNRTVRGLSGSVKRDTYTSANRLDPAFSWFLPGFLYTLVGLDCSLVELFAQEGYQPAVRWHIAQRPVIVVNGVSSPNQWLYTLLGVERELAKEFSQSIVGYKFRKKKGDQQVEYSVRADTISLVDPFSAALYTVAAEVFVPTNLTQGRSLRLVESSPVARYELHG